MISIRLDRRRLWVVVLIAIVLSIAGSVGFVNSVIPPPAAQTWVPLKPQNKLVYVKGHENGPQLGAEAAILLENTTGTVLYAKNAQERRPMASTTKIMTAVLALEQGRLDQEVEISRYAAWTRGSSAGLQTGERLPLKDLLHGLLLSSGNDAAVAIGEYIAGSEKAFVAEMNQRARELGLGDTQFRNPHGLDTPGHYSSALDLALLTRVALLYPTFAEIVAKKQYATDYDAWRNTNQLLFSFEGAEGVKTGTTSGAGRCLVAAATREGMQLISVVLDSHGRWSESARLLNFGFDNYNIVTLARKGEKLATIPVARGMAPAIAIASDDVQALVHKDEMNQIQVHLNLRRMTAPVTRGQILGDYTIYVGDREAARIPLMSGVRIERRWSLSVLWDWLRRHLGRL